MLIRVKDNFKVSYHKNVPKLWEMDGMMYRFFKFRFGDKLYTEFESPKGAQHGNMVYYNLNTDV